MTLRLICNLLETDARCHPSCSPRAVGGFSLSDSPSGCHWPTVPSMASRLSRARQAADARDSVTSRSGMLLRAAAPSPRHRNLQAGGASPRSNAPAPQRRGPWHTGTGTERPAGGRPGLRIRVTVTLPVPLAVTSHARKKKTRRLSGSGPQGRASLATQL